MTSGQEQTVSHMPDRLAEVLYKSLTDNNVLVSLSVTGQSRSAPVGVWVQGGGIEIPCAYEVKAKTGLRQLRKDLKESLQRLTPTAHNTIWYYRY